MSNTAALNSSVLAAAARSAMGSTGTSPAQPSAPVQPASAPAALQQVMSTPASAANATPAGPGIWQDIGALMAKLFDLIRRLIRFVVGIFFPPRSAQAEGKGADGQGKEEKDKTQDDAKQGEDSQAQALKQGFVDQAGAAKAQTAQEAQRAQAAPPDAASAVMAQHQKIADEHLAAANDQTFKAAETSLLRAAFEEFALDLARTVNEVLRTGESPETQDQRMERAFEALRRSLVQKTEDELVALSNMREEAPDDLKHVMALIEEDRISEQELAHWAQQSRQVGDYLRVRQALQLHRMELESLEKVSREQVQALRSFYARPSAVKLHTEVAETATTSAVSTPVEQAPPAPVHQEERAPRRNIFARPQAPVESSANQASAVAPASSTSAAVETAPRQGISAFAALALQSRLQEEAEGLADSGDEHEEPETAPVERPRG